MLVVHAFREYLLKVEVWDVVDSTAFERQHCNCGDGVETVVFVVAAVAKSSALACC